MKRTRFGLCTVTLALLGAACGGESPSPGTAAAPPPVETTAPATPTPLSPAVPVQTPEPAPAKAKLSMQVVTGSPEGFLVNSTIVQGAKDVVVIDAQFTLADGKKLAEAVLATKKNLTQVFVTHYHPDHYFGFVAVKQAFPNAKLVALPATVEFIQKTWADKVKQWKPLYKDAITDKPVVPEPLAGNTLDLEDQKLEIVGGSQGDSTDAAYVLVPQLKAIVTGDIVYDGVFPWTAETTPDSRKEWTASLDKLAASGATVIVPGHQKLDKKQEPTNLDFTKTFLRDFDDAVSASKKPADVQTKIKTKYPDVALDVVLKLGAESAFAKPAKKPTKASPAK